MYSQDVLAWPPAFRLRAVEIHTHQIHILKKNAFISSEVSVN